MDSIGPKKKIFLVNPKAVASPAVYGSLSSLPIGILLLALRRGTFIALLGVKPEKLKANPLSRPIINKTKLFPKML